MFQRSIGLANVISVVLSIVVWCACCDRWETDQFMNGGGLGGLDRWYKQEERASGWCGSG